IVEEGGAAQPDARIPPHLGGERLRRTRIDDGVVVEQPDSVDVATREQVAHADVVAARISQVVPRPHQHQPYRCILLTWPAATFRGGAVMLHVWDGSGVWGMAERAQRRRARCPYIEPPLNPVTDPVERIVVGGVVADDDRTVDSPAAQETLQALQGIRPPVPVQHDNADAHRPAQTMRSRSADTMPRDRP